MGLWKFRGATWLLALLWLVGAVWIALHLAGQAPDDMFITYRYAWNLAHGEGFVFNPGERVFGLTNPGLGLLLALLHGVTRVPVHLVGTGVYALSLGALAVLLLREGRRRGMGLEAAVGGTLVVGSSYLWLNQGSAGVTVLALLAGSALTAERRPVASGLLAGVAVWFRPDAGLGVLIMGLLLWAGRRRIPWRWGLAAAGVIVAGLVAAWAWFGEPLPQTLEAKRIMAGSRPNAWAGPTRFWSRAALFLPRHWGPAWLLVGAGGIAGLWPLVARGGRALRTVALYGVAVALAYPLLGVPFYSWYIVPSVVACLYGLATLGVGLARGAAGEDRTEGDAVPGRARHVVTATVLVLLLGPVLLSVGTGAWGWLERASAGRYASYRDAGLWIREHTLPEERIAYGEIGNVAYWSRRPVDDLLGLVTPEALPYVADGDPLGAFRALRPDIFLGHPKNPHPAILQQPWFRENYYPAATIEAPPDGRGAVTVYRRRPSAEPWPTGRAGGGGLAAGGGLSGSSAPSR